MEHIIWLAHGFYERLNTSPTDLVMPRKWRGMTSTTNSDFKDWRVCSSRRLSVDSPSKNGWNNFFKYNYAPLYIKGRKGSFYFKSFFTNKVRPRLQYEQFIWILLFFPKVNQSNSLQGFDFPKPNNFCCSWTLFTDVSKVELTSLTANALNPFLWDYFNNLYRCLPKTEPHWGDSNGLQLRSSHFLCMPDTKCKMMPSGWMMLCSHSEMCSIWLSFSPCNAKYFLVCNHFLHFTSFGAYVLQCSSWYPYSCSSSLL